MADAVKGLAELEKCYRYKARCAPAVSIRARCGMKVPVVRGLGCGRNAQLAFREKKEGRTVEK